MSSLLDTNVVSEMSLKRDPFEVQKIWDARRATRGILPALRGRNAIWHRTNVEGIRAILASRAILPNPVGRLPSRHERASARSVGRVLGAVSLFDFDTKDRLSVLLWFDQWREFLLHFDPTVFIRLGSAVRKRPEFIDVRAMLPDEVTRGLLDGDVPYVRRRIPHVEAYYRGPVSTDLIEGYLLIDQHADSNWRFVEIESDASALSAIERIGAGWRDEADIARTEAAARGEISVADMLSQANAMRRIALNKEKR